MRGKQLKFEYKNDHLGLPKSLEYAPHFVASAQLDGLFCIQKL